MLTHAQTHTKQILGPHLRSQFFLNTFFIHFLEDFIPQQILRRSISRKRAMIKKRVTKSQRQTQ